MLGKAAYIVVHTKAKLHRLKIFALVQAGNVTVLLDLLGQF